MDQLKAFQTEVHTVAQQSGWWDCFGEYKPDAFNKPEKIALMHSELSEALEALRADDNAPDLHCPEFLNLEVELADCIIRILDFAEAFDLNVIDAMVAKHNANMDREYRHGGKAF